MGPVITGFSVPGVSDGQYTIRLAYVKLLADDGLKKRTVTEGQGRAGRSPLAGGKVFLLRWERSGAWAVLNPI